jgi:hypothetical protein
MRSLRPGINKISARGAAFKLMVTNSRAYSSLRCGSPTDAASAASSALALANGRPETIFVTTAASTFAARSSASVAELASRSPMLVPTCAFAAAAIEHRMMAAILSCMTCSPCSLSTLGARSCHRE